MLTATGLTMHYGTQVLFSDVDLQLDPGKRYGIVGANGSGKSTLLQILAGEIEPTAGEIYIPNQARVGVLEQDHYRYEQTRILDVVMMGHAELWQAMAGKEAMLSGPEEDFDDVRFCKLEDVIMRLDGYTLEARAHEVLEGLGIPTAVHEEPLRVLSGGFKLRALLAQTITSRPELLFLDEPTNHLDIVAIKWLEDFLAAYPGVVAVVSHDHRFLDAMSTDTLDVDYQTVTAYRGNYSAFVQQRDEHRARMEAEIAKRKKEIEDHRAFIARFKAKATKARQANSRQKRLDKIEIEELPPSSREHPSFGIQARRPSGREVLAVKELWKAYEDKIVLADVSLTVERGDRLALIGPNGVGKSTLLKIAVGELEADEGSVFWGYETDVGYFPQDHADALGDPEQTVASWMWDACPGEGLGAVIARLARVLFSRDDTDKAVGQLSGGETARLLFARLAAQQPTVLVLDEPTNHLDLEGIEALAEALEAYDGTLIFVSHDRWFVERLATRIIQLQPEGGLEDFRGSYADFMRRHEVDHLDVEQAAALARKSRRKAKKKRKRAR